MKIEKPGFYRTRDGRKVEIAAINQGAAEYARCIGWINGLVFTCGTEGSILSYKDHGGDIVSEWIEPVPWDWSATPPWLFWLFKKESGGWLLSDFKPVLMEHGHGWKTAGYVVQVPSDYSPKWSGDWKQSITLRPGYKEAK